MRARHRSPYRAALVPAIAAATPHLRAETLATADDAARSPASTSRSGTTWPDWTRCCCARSPRPARSTREHLTAGARAIALAEIGGEENATSANAELVAANAAAMRLALDHATVDEAGVLAVHDALMRRRSPTIAGRWRTEAVWIGGSSYGPHGATFVAPRHEDVPEAMADLMAFARRGDLPVLSHTAIAHAHFETIHPFPDGNGRTGRALLQAMLRAGGLTRSSTPPVSAGLLTAPEGYVAALGAYRDGDVDAIVLAVAEAALVGIANSRVLVEDLHAVRERWGESVQARRDAVAWRVADLLVCTPVITAAIVARETGATSANVHRALRTLVAAGVLTELGGRRRGRFWQAREVLDALDAFAERAGRRR